MSTAFILPKRCAQAVAEVFGRRLNAIVIVRERGVFHTEVFPCSLENRPGEKRVELNYPPAPVA